MPKNTIRVGQRLINWNGQRGYGLGERFKVEWLDADDEVEDAQYVTLEQFEKEGIKRGRGVMPWAQ